jgi:hypothetical protein
MSLLYKKAHKACAVPLQLLLRRLITGLQIVRFTAILQEAQIVPPLHQLLHHLLLCPCCATAQLHTMLLVRHVALLLMMIAAADVTGGNAHAMCMLLVLLVLLLLLCCSLHASGGAEGDVDPVS